jgi:hypothetical protein
LIDALYNASPSIKEESKIPFHLLPFPESAVNQVNNLSTTSLSQLAENVEFTRPVVPATGLKRKTLPTLASGDGLLSATFILTMAKVQTHVCNKLHEMDKVRYNGDHTHARTRRMQSGIGSICCKFIILIVLLIFPNRVFPSQEYADIRVDIICKDTVLSPSLSLATVHRCIWKSGKEMTLFYRESTESASS